MRHAQDIRIRKPILKHVGLLTILWMVEQAKCDKEVILPSTTESQWVVAINAHCERSLDSCDNLLMQMKGEGEEAQNSINLPITNHHSK